MKSILSSKEHIAYDFFQEIYMSLNSSPDYGEETERAVRSPRRKDGERKVGRVRTGW